MRAVLAQDLQPGDVLALPFGKSATVQEVHVGTQFSNILTEHGKSRIARMDEVMIESEEQCGDFQPHPDGHGICVRCGRANYEHREQQ